MKILNRDIRGLKIKMENKEEEQEFKLSYPKTKEEAQEEAKTFQNWASEQNLSYGELIDFQDYFKNLGKEFNLTEEFKENCIC